MRPRGVLAVFAKEPRPGQVKTRMTPPLRPEQAATLYAHLLDDVLALSAEACRRFGLDGVLALHPPDAGPRLAGRVPAGFRIVAQRGPDLSARLARAVAELAAGGDMPILVRGSDSPGMDLEAIGAAIAGLAAHDLVVAPDRDGGYNLVGLRSPVSGLFDHTMSAPSSLAELLERARERGLCVQVLRPGFDLDTVGDLDWLARARASGDTLPCPRTLAWLDAENLWAHSP